MLNRDEMNSLAFQVKYHEALKQDDLKNESKHEDNK